MLVTLFLQSIQRMARGLPDCVTVARLFLVQFVLVRIQVRQPKKRPQRKLGPFSCLNVKERRSTMLRQNKIKLRAKRIQNCAKTNASLLVIWIEAGLYKLQSNLLEFWIGTTLMKLQGNLLEIEHIHLKLDIKHAKFHRTFYVGIFQKLGSAYVVS